MSNIICEEWLPKIVTKEPSVINDPNFYAPRIKLFVKRFICSSEHLYKASRLRAGNVGYALFQDDYGKYAVTAGNIHPLEYMLIGLNYNKCPTTYWLDSIIGWAGANQHARDAFYLGDVYSADRELADNILFSSIRKITNFYFGKNYFHALTPDWSKFLDHELKTIKAKRKQYV